MKMTKMEIEVELKIRKMIFFLEKSLFNLAETTKQRTKARIEMDDLHFKTLEQMIKNAKDDSEARGELVEKLFG